MGLLRNMTNRPKLRRKSKLPQAEDEETIVAAAAEAVQTVHTPQQNHDNGGARTVSTGILTPATGAETSFAEKQPELIETSEGSDAESETGFIMIGIDFGTTYGTRGDLLKYMLKVLAILASLGHTRSSQTI